MKFDIFYNTGFDIVNIPCNPELLYNGTFDYDTYENIELVQSDWLAYITIGNDDISRNRDADYVIITDEDKNTRTCYIIDHYEMEDNGTCKFYLILDPYNTAGGLEPVTIDGETHEPMVVIDASAERISVPLYSRIEGQPGNFLQADDNEFFTLPEPFSPAGRLHMHYDELPMTEYIPPQPGPITPDWQNFRYPTNNVASGTVGYIKPSIGTYAGQYIMAGSPGVPTMSIITSAGEYQDVEVLSVLPGTFPSATVFSDRFQFFESIYNNMYYNYRYIVDQKSNFTTEHQLLFNDIDAIILPFVNQYITNISVLAEEGNTTDYELYITPMYIDSNGNNNFILQNGTGDNATVRLSQTANPPFTDECLYYKVRIKMPTGGNHQYAVKRDGTWVQIN